jgi:hypothetical protein
MSEPNIFFSGNICLEQEIKPHQHYSRRDVSNIAIVKKRFPDEVIHPFDGDGADFAHRPEMLG